MNWPLPSSPRSYITSIIILFSIGLYPTHSDAQSLDELLELLTIHPNKKAAELDSTIYPAKAIFTPVVSYAPETNWSFGIGMKGLFKMRGSGPETRTSNIPLTFQYTLDNKYFFFSGFAIFSPQERYMLTGNVRIQSFPSLFFGVGEDTPKSNEEQFAYNQILIEPILLKNLLRKYLFVGAGIRYNRISGVNVEPDGLLATTEQPGARGSTSSGIQLAMIYDSRDNILNASRGKFISLTQGFYGRLLGSTQNYQLTRLDMRYYLQPFNTSSSILGFQFLTSLSHGDTPLIDMGRLGGNEIMRGYFEGRYTERHLIAGQVEWRQKLTHRWGVVAFAGLGTVASSIEAFDFKNIRPTSGFGIRFLIDEEENLNLRLDFGFGNEKSNYYFKIAEAF